MNLLLIPSQRPVPAFRYLCHIGYPDSPADIHKSDHSFSLSECRNSQPDRLLYLVFLQVILSVGFSESPTLRRIPTDNKLPRVLPYTPSSNDTFSVALSTAFLSYLVADCLESGYLLISCEAVLSYLLPIYS
jgi:hypothetical protein